MFVTLADFADFAEAYAEWSAALPEPEPELADEPAGPPARYFATFEAMLADADADAADVDDVSHAA